MPGNLLWLTQADRGGASLREVVVRRNGDVARHDDIQGRVRWKLRSPLWHIVVFEGLSLALC